MPRFSKERLNTIKKSYDLIANPDYANINEFHYIDGMVNTIKGVWKDEVSEYNPDPEAVERATNSTIAYYLALKSFPNRLKEGEKLSDNYEEALEDLQSILDRITDISQKQLDAIGKALDKKPDDYENVGFIEEDGSIRTMADLRAKETEKEYKSYVDTFNDVFTKMKDKKGKEAILETEQVSKLRNPSITITNNDVKNAIELANSLDSKKSMKEIIDDKDRVVSECNSQINTSKKNINKSIQDYASGILFDDKNLDSNKQQELKDNVFTSQVNQKEAQENMFTVKCGTYLKCKERLDSHGLLYQFFMRSAYKKEQAMVNALKEDLKNSYHMEDAEIEQIENSRKALNEKKIKDTDKFIDKDIMIDTNSNTRVKSNEDEKALEEGNLLHDVAEDNFYKDLAIAVNENIYQKTSDFIDEKKSKAPTKGVEK